MNFIKITQLKEFPMKKFSLSIVLLICATNICCVHKKMTNSSAKIEMKNIEGHYTNIDGIPQELPEGIAVCIEEKYVTLSNGAIVDRRITEDTVDMIFKRFEAIENGDVAAFRSTLGEMQDGVDYYYQLKLIFDFFGDLFDIDTDAFEDAVADGGEELTEIGKTLFYGEHPLRSRNTALAIKKLEITDTGALRVIARNNKNEKIIYNFIYW